jgi:hypothetical protein
VESGKYDVHELAIEFSLDEAISKYVVFGKKDDIYIVEGLFSSAI